jgi:hypothetical protein
MTLGKFLSMPFMFVGLPFLCVTLLIRYGLEDTVDILEKFNKALKEKNNVGSA